MKKKSEQKINLKGSLGLSGEAIGVKGETGYGSENSAELLYRKPEILKVEHFNEALKSFGNYLIKTKSNKKTVFFIDDADVYSFPK